MLTHYKHHIGLVPFTIKVVVVFCPSTTFAPTHFRIVPNVICILCNICYTFFADMKDAYVKRYVDFYLPLISGILEWDHYKKCGSFKSISSLQENNDVPVYIAYIPNLRRCKQFTFNLLEYFLLNLRQHFHVS